MRSRCSATAAAMAAATEEATLDARTAAEPGPEQNPPRCDDSDDSDDWKDWEPGPEQKQRSLDDWEPDWHETSSEKDDDWNPSRSNGAGTTGNPRRLTRTTGNPSRSK